MEDFDSIGCFTDPRQRRLDLGSISNKNDPQLSVRCYSLDGTGDDRLGSMITAHRVKRDLHGSLLSFHHHHFAPLVMTAVRANTVRQHGLITALAILNLHRFYVLMAPSFALTGVRGASLGNCHSFSCAKQLWSKASYRRSAENECQARLQQEVPEACAGPRGLWVGDTISIIY
jgi:hypothetical protein